MNIVYQDQDKLICATSDSKIYPGRKIYISSSQSSRTEYQEKLIKGILRITPSTIFYRKDLIDPIKEIKDDILSMNLFIALIDRDYLDSYIEEFEFAYSNHISILPIITDRTIYEELEFNKRIHNLQAVSIDQKNIENISDNYKFKEYIEKKLVSDDLPEKIRNAFDAYIFISYRKKDRAYAKKISYLVNDNDFCRDVAVWYDEYLALGEDFNESIRTVLEKSKVFIMAVTPNLVIEDNYIQKQEYPMALELEKNIVPIEAIETNRNLLSNKFPNIPNAISLNKNKVSLALRKYIVHEDWKLNSDPKHLFFIGLAYIYGIDTIINTDKGIRILEESFKGGCLEAGDKLVDLYESYNDYVNAIRVQKSIVNIATNQQFEYAYRVCKDNKKLGDIAYVNGYFMDVINSYNFILARLIGASSPLESKNTLYVFDDFGKEEHYSMIIKMVASYIQLGKREEAITFVEKILNDENYKDNVKFRTVLMENLKLPKCFNNLYKKEGTVFFTVNDILHNLLDINGLCDKGMKYLVLNEINHGSTQAWCIGTYSSNISKTSYYEDRSIIDACASNIIMNWQLNYDDHELSETLAGYEAVQIAIWCKMAGKDPSTLPTTKGIDEALASKVRALAHELYASSFSYDPYTLVRVNGVQQMANSGTYNLGDISNESALYRRDGVYYWKTPLISVARSSGSNNLSINIDVSNISCAIVTDSNGNEVTKTEAGKYLMGNNSSYGTHFYVYVPIETEASNSHIDINTVMDTIGVTAWNGGDSQNLTSMLPYSKEGEFKLNLTWTKGTVNVTPATKYVGNLLMQKKGLGPYSVSSTIIDGMTVYTIVNKDIPLQGAKFDFHWASGTFDDGHISKYTITTDEEGKITLSDINVPKGVINEDAKGKFVNYRICEHKPLPGYTLKSKDWNDPTCEPCKIKSANISNGKEFNLSLVNDNAIIDIEKRFSVSIKVINKDSTPITGMAFGIFNTEKIQLYSDKRMMPKGLIVGYGKTNSEGELTLGKGLIANQNYTIKQIKELKTGLFDFSSILCDGKPANQEDNEILIDMSNFSINDEEEKKFSILFITK